VRGPRAMSAWFRARFQPTALQTLDQNVMTCENSSWISDLAAHLP
jgi:hypothetical protein